MRKLLARYGDLEQVYLLMGEGGVWDYPVAIQTVLGSCVSVTFHARDRGVGAIFHAFLPTWREHEPPGTSWPAQAYRYVDSAIETVLAAMARRRIAKAELVVKVFGGCNAMTGDVGVGRRNAEVAFGLLKDQELKPAAIDVGGTCGRKLFFLTTTGEVFVKQLNKTMGGR
jgi:chemotaxis protein CheD